ncbi:hypothetical protein D1871_14495 [Nakamurella silvestris]|nr:hypothetical protein D1871_14495 [Nakamurella silvestris]
MKLTARTLSSASASTSLQGLLGIVFSCVTFSRLQPVAFLAVVGVSAVMMLNPHVWGNQRSSLTSAIRLNVVALALWLLTVVSYRAEWNLILDQRNVIGADIGLMLLIPAAAISVTWSLINIVLLAQERKAGVPAWTLDEARTAR